ncbi:OB-fold protein [Nocardioides kribbensis]|uniref:tRNA_anti-like n=1 Tax=Nocardioides kribbensis TaxID=305517 RepID=A0ABV1NXX7_9ACTN
MRRANVAILAMVLGAVGAGCAVPDDSDGGSGGSSAGKPDLKVTAKKILKEFEDNEAAADGKYKDKTLQVSGTVSKIDTELLDDEQYVIQVGAGTDFDIFTVNCDDQSSDDVSSLKKGKAITVIGEFEDGGDLGIELDNCSIA